jgi:F0F1-type ATP synthase membrane subunit b/b'
MNDRDDTNLPPEENISDEISERVRSVLAAAEGAATAIRHEAEQQAQIKRRAAEAEGQRYLEDAKAEAEALLEARMKRISELSDSIIEGAEAILMRIDGAQEAKRQLETMVHALATAAEALAAESQTGQAPPRPRPVAVEDEPPPRMRAVPEPTEPPEPIGPDPATVTELHVPERPQAVPPEDSGPAEPSDLQPVDVVPDADDDSEVEVVDAVEVVDEPELDADRRTPVERLRKPAARDGNGGSGAESAESAGKQAHSRGFDGDDMLAARLVALQMAVAGSARDEVEDHLRKAFALEEPGKILNDVFGTESKL